MSALADKIRRLREQHGLSQRALEQKSGVSLRTIVSLEKGESVRKDTLLRILSVFKLSEDERIDALIAWIRAELGEDANKIFIKKAAGLKPQEQFMQRYSLLTDSEKEQILKAMQRQEILDLLAVLNENYEKLTRSKK